MNKKITQHGKSWIHSDWESEKCPECDLISAVESDIESMSDDFGVCYTLQFICQKCDCMWEYRRTVGTDEKTNESEFSENKMNPTKQKAIEHYERMIKCAKTFKGEFSIDEIYGYILDNIGEAWGGWYCSYCLKYSPGCYGCPLYSGSIRDCCNGLWEKISYSETLNEFIQSLENVLNFIKENG